MFNVYITLRVDYNGVVFSLCHFFPTSTLMCCQRFITHSVEVITYITRDFLTIVVHNGPVFLRDEFLDQSMPIEAFDYL